MAILLILSGALAASGLAVLVTTLWADWKESKALIEGIRARSIRVEIDGEIAEAVHRRVEEELAESFEDRPIVFAAPKTRYVWGKIISRGPGAPHNPPGDDPLLH